MNKKEEKQKRKTEKHMKNIKIYSKLKEYKKTLDLKYDVLFIGLKGSQNYNLDTEDSDIDVIAVVKPHKYSRTGISETVSFGTNNQDEATVCDIFKFTELVRKGNCSYIEAINSQYTIGKLPAKFYDAKSNATTLYYMMLQKYHALSKRYESKIPLIEKYGYDPKQLHHIVRLSYLLNEIVNCNRNVNDVKVIDDSDKKFLIDFKTSPIVNYKELAEEHLQCCNELKEQLEEFKPNDISDEYIYEYLDSLDNQINQTMIASAVSNTYEILRNTQYLEKSYKELTKDLKEFYNIDVVSFEVKAKTIKANKATKDYKVLDKIYSELLDLIIGDEDTMINKLYEMRTELNMSECQKLVKEYKLKVIDEYSQIDEIINSQRFKEFTQKYNQELKEVPGFYQKYDINKNEWKWKVKLVAGIIIPNRVNGLIRNIQIRPKNDINGKYLNMSSSDKKGRFYKYPTRAHNGFCLFENTKSLYKDLVVTEGFFKGFTCISNIDEIKELFYSQGIIIDNDFDVLSMPGISYSLDNTYIPKYNNIILAFDNDCSDKNQQESYRQYLSMKHKLEVAGVNILEYIPKSKIDEDIFNLKKEKEKEKEKDL